MKTLRVITLGCSKNTVDTEHLLYQLRNTYEAVPETDDRSVDVLLVNTCGFIGDAKEESIQTILEAVAQKKEGKAGKVAVMGCLAQRYARDLPSLIPEVDLWFGARDLAPVVQGLGGRISRADITGRVRHSDSLPYAFLKISEGCDRRCAYCAIPHIRGNHRSVPMETLLAEAETLAAGGVKELILIAQDTTYYGLDLYGRRALADLLRKLSAISGIEWIRLHYCYPEDFPLDVLDEMAVNPKICKYIDIPLQHISDKVLRNMRRGVTGKRTRELVAMMRERVPGVVLRTTLIVGHPGEGWREFQRLKEFVQEAHFERLGAFRYSEEEGTWGARHLQDEVSPRVKQNRLDALMALQQEISFSFNQSRVGKTERVLVDGFADGILICRSQWESPEVDGEILVRYLPQDFQGASPASLVGKFLNVKITAADSYDLTAEPVMI